MAEDAVVHVGNDLKHEGGTSTVKSSDLSVERNLVVQFDTWIAEDATVDVTNEFRQEGGTATIKDGTDLQVDANGIVGDVNNAKSPSFNVANADATFAGSLSILSGQANVFPDGSVSANQVVVGGTSGTAAPTLVANGTVTGAVQLNQGVIQGDGDIIGDVTGVVGSVAPGNSAGLLTVDGDYNQGPGVTLEIELGGLTPEVLHDVLHVTGTASLDGTLGVSLINGYSPNVGDEYVVLTSATAISGAFSSLVSPSGHAFDVDYGNINANAVTLTVSAIPEPSAFLYLGLLGLGVFGFKRRMTL